MYILLFLGGVGYNHNYIKSWQLYYLLLYDKLPQNNEVSESQESGRGLGK